MHGNKVLIEALCNIGEKTTNIRIQLDDKVVGFIVRK